MLLLAKARLKARRWPSRSVSARTPSQSKRMASRVWVAWRGDRAKGTGRGVSLLGEVPGFGTKAVDGVVANVERRARTVALVMVARIGST